MEVFSVKKQKRECRKNWTKSPQKNIILKVTINNFDLDIQIDTNCEVTLIPKKFRESTGKPTLRKSSLLHRQFDGLVIKSFGYFEGSLELEDKFKVIPIIVTICKKNHGLLGNDVLKINSTKLINVIITRKNGKLKKTNYKANLKLKENVTPSYYRCENYQHICCH